MAKTLWDINFSRLNVTNDNQFKAFGGKYTHTENLTNGVYTADGQGSTPSFALNAVDIDWNGALWPSKKEATLPSIINSTGELIKAIKWASDQGAGVDSNTWRPIKVKDTEIGQGKELRFLDGTDIEVKVSLPTDSNISDLTINHKNDFFTKEGSVGYYQIAYTKSGHIKQAVKYTIADLYDLLFKPQLRWDKVPSSIPNTITDPTNEIELSLFFNDGSWNDIRVKPSNILAYTDEDEEYPAGSTWYLTPGTYYILAEYTSIGGYNLVTDDVREIEVVASADYISVSSITLDPSSITLNIGSSILITPTFSPATCTNKSVLWKSNDVGVSVTSSGKVSVNRYPSGGTCTITCESLDSTVDHLVYGTCTITVNKQVARNLYLYLDTQSFYENVTNENLPLTLPSIIGNVLNFECVFDPANVTDLEVTWSLTDRYPADWAELLVNEEDGKKSTVSFEGEGLATLVCVWNSNTSIKALCRISATETLQVEPIEDITLAIEGLSNNVVDPETECTVVASVLPASSTEKLKWEVLNVDYASIVSTTDRKCILHINLAAAGKYFEIKCSGLNAYTSYRIQVNSYKVLRIELSETSISLAALLRKTISVSRILPLNASDKGVTWSTLDSEWLQITPNNNSCEILALKAWSGLKKVTCTSNDGNTSTYCLVTYVEHFGEDHPDLTNFTINPLEQTISIGDTFDITYNFQYPNGTVLRWESIDPEIATVTSSGQVTGISVGETDIVFLILDMDLPSGDLVIGTRRCHVTVQAIPVSGLSIIYDGSVIEGNEPINIYVGQLSKVFSAYIVPSNATNKVISWSATTSSIDLMAQPDNTCIIVAKEGTEGNTCRLICSTSDGSDITASCNISINSLSASIDKINLKYLKNDKYALIEDGNYLMFPTAKTITLKAELDPSNAAYYDIHWNFLSGSLFATLTVDPLNIFIATVTLNNDAPSGSECVVVCRADDNTMSKATCTIKYDSANLAKLITEIEVNPSNILLAPQDTYQLSSSIKPQNVESKTVLWTSSDSEVATVNSTGLVTAVANGTCNIRCRSHNNSSIYGQCVVTVSSILPTEIVLTNSDNQVVNNLHINIDLGESITINATVLPAEAAVNNLIWSEQIGSTTLSTSLPFNYILGQDSCLIIGSRIGTGILICKIPGTEIVARCTIEVNATSVSSGNYEVNPDHEDYITDSNLITSTGKIEVQYFDPISGLYLNIDDDNYIHFMNNSDSVILKANYINKFGNTIPTISWIANSNKLEIETSSDDSNLDELEARVTLNLGNPIGNGEGEITCVASTGVSKVVKITYRTVNDPTAANPLVNIKLDKLIVELITGAISNTLVPTFYPINTTQTLVTWSSSNNNIATINNGVITAVNQGNVMIGCTSYDNASISATCLCIVSDLDIETTTDITTIFGPLEYAKFDNSSTFNIVVEDPNHRYVMTLPIPAQPGDRFSYTGSINSGGMRIGWTMDPSLNNWVDYELFISTTSRKVKDLEFEIRAVVAGYIRCASLIPRILDLDYELQVKKLVNSPVPVDLNDLDDSDDSLDDITIEPTEEPTEEPTGEPTGTPSPEPTEEP